MLSEWRLVSHYWPEQPSGARINVFVKHRITGKPKLVDLIACNSFYYAPTAFFIPFPIIRFPPLSYCLCQSPGYAFVRRSLK
jgi:hypothetical protein